MTARFPSRTGQDADIVRCLERFGNEPGRWPRAAGIQQPLGGGGDGADPGSPMLLSRVKSAPGGHGHLLGRHVFISDSQST